MIQAKETEQRIRDELRSELGTAVATLTKDKQLAEARVDKLRTQQASLRERIAKLAAVRAKYGNIASEVAARNELMQNTERELASAEAARDASETSSLITRLEEPILGEKPIGPGRSVILVGSTAAGLFFGFGVVFLLAPVDGSTKYGRRSQDFSEALGRRASDLRGGNEAASTAAPGQERRAAVSAPAARSNLNVGEPNTTERPAADRPTDNRSFSERAAAVPSSTPPAPQSNVAPAAPVRQPVAEVAAPSATAASPSAVDPGSAASTNSAVAGQPAGQKDGQPVGQSAPAAAPTASALELPSGAVEDPRSLAEAQAVIAEALRSNLS